MVKRGDRLADRTITINEKILIHLKESPPLRDSIDAPYALTQHGISENVGIRINHVSRAMKALRKDGFVEDVSARVRGEVRKRKAYTLTDSGLSKSEKLKKKVASKIVLLRKDGFEKELPVNEALEEMGNATTTALLRMVDSEGVVDVSEEEKAEKLVVFSKGLPKEEPFYGRKGELAVLEEWLESRKEKILSLAGGRGMGKTSIALRAYHEWIPKRNTFWFSFQEWETGASFLEALSDFFKDMGKAHLTNHLKPGKKIDLWEVSGSVERDLGESKNVLILDEYPSKGKETETLLSIIMEAIARTENTKMLITQSTRSVPNRREYLVRGVLAEMDLLGLDKKSCEHLLSRKISSSEFDKIYRLTEGNPLHVKLMEAGKVEELIDTKDYTPEELALLKYMKIIKGTK
ncbi:MAG: ATP-binding protein [Thermoplasmata archaeon]